MKVDCQNAQKYKIWRPKFNYRYTTWTLNTWGRRNQEKLPFILSNLTPVNLHLESRRPQHLIPSQLAPPLPRRFVILFSLHGQLLPSLITDWRTKQIDNPILFGSTLWSHQPHPPLIFSFFFFFRLWYAIHPKENTSTFLCTSR